jgi:NitT/TauT family transport system ATP-binding protein
MIEVRDVSKSFARRGVTTEALRHISLTVQDHEFVTLLGPSGCGKSTLLHAIAGLVAVTHGDIQYGERRVAGLNVGVGYMPQKDTLLPWRTVEGNVAIALESRRDVSPRERRARVAEQLRVVGLAGFERHYPSELSGGMRRRVILARALVQDPDTLLMDEPFGPLDAQLRLAMQSELLRIWEQTRKTVVFVTHDLDEAIALADRVLVFTARPGRIKCEVRIEIPRPRADAFAVRSHPFYQAYARQIWDALKLELDAEPVG